jgi:hypothetical protein
VNLAATSKEVREQVPDAMRHLRETLRNLQAITTAINSGEGLIGRILRDSTTADRLDSIVARLDRITASLEQGEGALGMLALYREMVALMRDVRTVTAKIEPRHYGTDWWPRETTPRPQPKPHRPEPSPTPPGREMENLPPPPITAKVVRRADPHRGRRLGGGRSPLDSVRGQVADPRPWRGTEP